MDLLPLSGAIDQKKQIPCMFKIPRVLGVPEGATYASGGGDGGGWGPGDYHFCTIYIILKEFELGLS